MSWDISQDSELDFWVNNNANCANTYIEETKHYTIAPRLRLKQKNQHFELNGESVLDMGAGPVSILLKCTGYSKAYVADPLMDRFPSWVKERYKARGIVTEAIAGEYMTEHDPVDVTFCYNVLQHTIDPVKIIENMKRWSKEIRLFEWVDVPADDKHPHVLKADTLDEWLGVKGIREYINEKYCYTNSYYATWRK